MCLWQNNKNKKYITEVMLCFYCSLSNIAQFWFVPLLRMVTLVKWLILYPLGVSVVKILFLVKLIHILCGGTLKLYISCFIIKNFLYSFIYFHRVCTHGFQFHSLHSNPLLSFFDAKTIQVLASGSSLKWASVSFWCVSIIHVAPQDAPTSSSTFFAPALGIKHLSREPYFLLV